MSDELAPGALFSLEGRVAVVTGAARGNGLGIARALGAAGASVLLVDVNPAVVAAAESIRPSGGRGDGGDASAAPRASSGSSDTSAAPRTLGLALDVTDADAPDRILQAVRALPGRLAVLVNNAGISRGGGDPLDVPDEIWEATLAVNLTAPFRLTRALARAMAEGGGGSVINVTSLNAERAFPGNPAYVASKGGLRMLTKSFALDLAPRGIRVNAIGPGYFSTEMNAASWADPERRAARAARTMLGRWGDPERDLAGAVVFLASDASAYVTGQDLYVDGGWMGKGL